MTIKYHPPPRAPPQQRDARRELVDKVHVVLRRGGREQVVQCQVDLTQVREENVEFVVVGAREGRRYVADV
jgi:hypothetical protein